MGALSKGQIYGAVTVGERGQVVIPAGVRKSLKIGAGDRLIVVAKPDMIGLIPAEEFNRFINQASEALTKLKR
ncbi:MAG TPA: AbrB/MazE/SpoVT family DNA-binding domain-containing protein [Candidatus Omnitrophota bacterium]|nr:AbrB/MazE/SpoVT family DNA-binding domain-containing protein [Candidatus Omnitrophota bacterium]HPD84277.1 AbrB/MazE/SpoVT family DNA-binding domain-containing protein [Candidatus Omnitrophota bacterium]HRZ03133.1 AbrB/MazE/SpoVT family DNA-binding domain-containing protein [Candidatus Omnitrophota bacterium]